MKSMKVKTPIVAILAGLVTLLLPSLSCGQRTADDIFQRAQERFAQDEKNHASRSAEGREAADKALDNLKAERCFHNENESICQIVVLCSKAPEIAGESLPDDKELVAATQALDDVSDDLKRMASAIEQMKIASARFQRGARAARDRCEAKVRMAYRLEAGSSQAAKPDPDEVIEANTPNGIYDGPVAIRPLTIKPHLMGRVPPATARVPPNALR
jgi:phosphoglycolate phosphatase-like HAD superfamily hydrolase